LTGELETSKIIIFAEFGALTVREMEQLRRTLKDIACSLRVVKNNLVKKTLSALSKDEACKYFEGPNVIIWTKAGDESEVVKGIAKFAGASGKIKVKAGFLSSGLVGKDFLDKLLRLPSKKVLQAIVIGGIKSPLSKMVYDVRYPISRLILTLKTFSNKKLEEK
jgi:large subunit ribosomal protein L10